jgi:tripartite-type tricarboxylate transporter receptor subunit TctC
MKILAIAGAFVLSFGVSSISIPAPYPTKPVSLIVGWAPGGANDIMARLIARKLSEALGQSVIVVNRAGAGGTIAAATAAKSLNDGYTLFLGSTSQLSIAPNLYTNLGYDPVKSFAPIRRVVSTSFLMLVHPSVPARSLRELIDLAKSKPGQLSYGSPGAGSTLHIAAEMFKTQAGVDLLHVPYKGGASALPDLLSGRIHLMFGSPAMSLPHIRAGKVTALAVTATKRMSQLPNVPTAAEAGLPGYDISAWMGLLAPKGTPDDILKRLNAEVRKALAMREVQEVFSEQGFEPAPSSPEEFAALIREDLAKWSRAVKASGAKLE